MATDKNKILVYKDWKSTFDKLSDEEAGRLIKHFFNYVNDENPEAPDRITELIFEPIKQTLKRDLKKWEQTADRNRENGAKGGRPSKTKETQNNPLGYFETQNNPEKPVSVIVSDSVSNNIPPIEKIDWDALIVKFNLFFNKKTKLINKGDRAKFNARLKEGWTKMDIAAAMESIRSDPFHKEEGYKHVTYEYLSRDGTLQRHATKSENTDRIINDSWEAN